MKGRIRFGALLLAAGLLLLLAACNPAQSAEDAVTFSEENGEDSEPIQAQSTSSPSKAAELTLTVMELAGCPGRFGLILLKFLG